MLNALCILGTDISIAERLRRETRAEHDAAEQSLDLFGQTSTWQGYVALVRKLYGFFQPMEERLHQEFGTTWNELNLIPRRKVPWLEQDLRWLGIAPESFLSIPRCTHCLEFDTESDVAGYLYVTEGATLGGKFILKHVESSLGIHATHGGVYFNSYGEETGPMWRALRDALEWYVAGGGDPDEVVKSAKQTFHCFTAWVGARGAC